MDTKTSKRKNNDNDIMDDSRREKKTKRERNRSRSRENRNKDSHRKRKHSRSRSPYIPSKQERRQNDAPSDAQDKKAVPERRAKDTDMLNTRTGGAYIPPARLRMMQAQITDKSSVAYQRLAWEALKKSIHGHINKINVGNIGIIIKELLKENIVRGRGLLCRSVIQAQAASPTFTNVYAALVAAVNSRFPNIGELLLKRLVIQFKRGFKRNDKPICISSASFIAHLVNQRVAHEILALELLTLLVESPTDDSVEVAIAFLKECGQKLTEVSSKGVNAIFEMLRNILHEGQLDKRVQYMIEVMFQVWKDGFKDHPALIDELELVSEEEQFTHLLMLDDATDPQDILNVFKFDEKYEDNEQKYKTLSKEILGSDAESGDEDGSEETGSEESDDEEGEGEKAMTIIDNTETNLVALRRTIYLTINSSLDFEECAHKLMKMELKPGQEVELCHMFLDCCAEQRTYEKFYGLLAQRFCNINRMYIGPFEEIFKDSYATAHRLDTNRLRNVSKFFAHLLFTDSISWEVMECVKLNEEDTTSSSRIYIKILFQELAEYMGLKKLNDRLKDSTLQEAFAGIFPRDNPKNTRFSINFFTSIGLGGLTDELREHLKQMPKNVPAPVTDINVGSDSSSDSSSSSSSSDSSSSDSSSSDSEDENDKKKKSKKSNEKEKSKQNNLTEENASNKHGNDNDKRWGHDGFYDTYGENARRYDSRSERSEQNRDNFARPANSSRRYDDRDRHKENDRNNRDDRSSRDGGKRRSERDTRETEDVRRHHNGRDRRAERDNTENRSERISKYDDRDEVRRYDEKGSTREGREKRQDRDREENSNRSIRDNDRVRDRDESNRSNREDGRNRENSEREQRDKGRDKNNRIRDEDRYRDRNIEDSSNTKTKDKNARKNETNDTNKRDNYDVNTKEGKSKENRKEDESKSTETGDRSRRSDKNRNKKNNSDKKDDSEVKGKAKKKTSKDKQQSKRDKYKNKENSSYEDSGSTSDSSEEQDNNKQPARYWDVIDINNKEITHKYTEENERTPELKSKNDRKRER